MATELVPRNWNCDCLSIKGVTDFFTGDRCLAKKVIVAVVAGWTILHIGRKVLRRKCNKRKQYKRDTVILHQFPRGTTVPNISPFCLKLETFLRVANIPYEIDNLDPFGPNRKSPWISYNDACVPDSTLCIKYLSNELNVNLNEKLTDCQLAVAHAFEVMVDEHLFWCLVLHRFVYDERKEYLQLMRWPVPLPNFLFNHVFKRMWNTRTKHQGIGMHSRESVAEFTKKDLKAISDYLGDKDFLFGSEITEADCCVFGMLAQGMWTAPRSSPFKKWFSEDFRNLESYCIRMKERAFPDWDECLEKNR